MRQMKAIVMGMEDQEDQMTKCPCAYCSARPLNGRMDLMLDADCMGMTMAFPDEGVRYDMTTEQAWVIATQMANTLAVIQKAIGEAN